MKINMNIGLQGHYRIVVSKDAEMKEVVQDTGFFENIITDAGLHALARFSSSATSKGDFRRAFFKEMYLGSGATTPTAEDTSLENRGATGVDFSFFDVGKGEDLAFGDSRGVVIKKEFGKGSFVGSLSEVGLGVTTPAVLFSRALVVNEDGIPTPITVTANDYLTVYYTVRQYVPFPKTFNIVADIDGTPTPMEVRVQPWSLPKKGGDYEYFDLHAGRSTASGYFYSLAWSNVTNNFQGGYTGLITGSGALMLSFAPYDATNKPFESWGKLIVNETIWNNSNIKTVGIRGLPGSWQLRFTPEIVKTYGKKMEIEFGVRLGRYEGSQGLDDN